VASLEGRSASTTELVREPLELVHHHPGRLRVRAEAFRDEADGPSPLRAATLAIDGVTRVDHNPRTGSVLVEYEPGVAEPDHILVEIARAAGLAPVAEDALRRARSPSLVAVGVVQELNAVVGELTGQKADLRSLVPAGLAALSAYSWAFGKEPRLPRWDNLLWWSYSVFMNHHREEIERSADERRLAREERATVAPRPPAA
jgi:hypothetical protein